MISSSTSTRRNAVRESGGGAGSKLCPN
jgi:hypothetical protein